MVKLSEQQLNICYSIKRYLADSMVSVFSVILINSNILCCFLRDFRKFLEDINKESGKSGPNFKVIFTAKDNGETVFEAAKTRCLTQIK